MDALPAAVWNRDLAAHLYWRAGFGGTPDDLDRAVREGRERTVERLLDFPDEPAADAPGWITPDAVNRFDARGLRALPEEERRARQQAARQLERERKNALVGWWVDRMIRGTHPLQEKLTLLWHGHFATSFEKVNAAYPMWLQNQTFRRLAAGSWRDLVAAVAQDPAMLVYLDQARSTRQAPNENFAREVMELFTLGEGHYTEEDIREAARAFTGWTLSRERWEPAFRPRQHDDGDKTLFGRRGAWTGKEALGILLDQPRAAEFLASRLWRFFAGDPPAPEPVAALAAALRQADLRLRPALRALFHAPAFYAPGLLGRQVKSPAVWLAGYVRATAQAPPAAASLAALRALGQDLFQPPNVKGWDGGLAWIHTAALMQRYTLAARWLDGGGPPANRLPPASAERLLPKTGRGTPAAALRELAWRVLLGPPRPDDLAALAQRAREFPTPDQWTAAQIRRLARALVCSPHYQVC